ncbi:hypothetical protein I6F36_02690 [Bradyrhizobium sp. BRP19]|nr:hypothetical protein [Bradyrhizobium sp. BRP19]MCA1545720.1 hypothetical protein [Bradyrhizobium sp. BRP19]
MAARTNRFAKRKEKEDPDSHSLMRRGPQTVKLYGLNQEGAALAMDRIEQAFIATAVTGFLVMMVAIVWMMMS